MFCATPQVRDPSTLEWISISVAVSRGVYDAVNDRYFNLKTGELLTTQEAASRNLVKLGVRVSRAAYKHGCIL